MSREVRELPVLEGKVARDFFKQAEKIKVTKSKEYVQEHFRKTVEYLKEQELLHPRMPW